MKQARKYLIISWGMTLIILNVWLLVDVGIFMISRFDWYDKFRDWLYPNEKDTYDAIKAYFGIGWSLILLTLIQYVFLIRRPPKRTKFLASPANFEYWRNKVSSPYDDITDLPNTRFLVHPTGIKILICLIISTAALLFASDLFLVYKDLPRNITFWNNYVKDTSYQNCQYIMTSIVYLVASVISSICIVKYIKAVKNDASKTNDVSLN